MSIELEKEFENRKKFILDIVNRYVKEANINVTDNVISNLVIHLSLCVSRQLNGTYISTSHSLLESLKDDGTYEVSKSIVNEISEAFHVVLSQNEINTTAMYLSNLSLLDLDFNTEFDLVDDVLENIMNETLVKIKDELSIDLSHNKTFIQGMTLHFYPAIERLKNDQQIQNNPLVDQLTAASSDEYKCALILNSVVDEYYHKEFNKHELAYISLHFATALN